MDRSVQLNMLGRIAIVLFLCASLPVEAQRSDVGRQYDALIDRLFAVPEDEDDVHILRFSSSSFEPEMQVAFTLPFGTTECHVRVRHLPTGARPLLSQFLDRIRVAPPLRPEAVAEGLSVTRTIVSVPCGEELAKRIEEISAMTMPVPRNYSIPIDGTAFRLEIRKGSRRLTFDAHAGGLDDAYEEPVLAWMASIGRAFRDAVRRQ